MKLKVQEWYKETIVQYSINVIYSVFAGTFPNPEGYSKEQKISCDIV